MTKKTIAIVDPYSSGALLSPLFKADGHICIAIHSLQKVPSIFASSYKKNDFDIEIFFDGGNFAYIADKLKNYGCSVIMPGAESGVTLADNLAHYLKLNHNLYDLSKARRDKFAMQECLKQNGLKYIQSHEVSNIKELNEKVNSLSYPVIIKPINSAGSDDVYKCYSYEEAIKATSIILNKDNALGLYNDKVLVQEFIEGREYVVDSISCEGRHFTTNGCLYTKMEANDSDVVYRKMEFLPPDSKELIDIIEYNNKVLDALGFLYGPSHSEIMMTNDGPVLIETGARIHGGYSPRTVAEISNLSQLNLILPSYCDVDKFNEMTENGVVFHKSACVFFLVNYIEGNVKSLNFTNKIESLPSFYDMVFLVEKGDYCPKTISLYTCPAWIVLANKDSNQIRKDIDFIKTLEKKGIFEILSDNE
ncbi:hypothetical protein A1019T_02499 [Psychrobacter pasteurii]|uniref:ATP-grasp domain-containing protein n=1 Tax=Psychrobacter pasteurii TaxID=1945520 RepID=A0A1R4EJ46_9GAMM|nr:ATP-grasp domain-containing protein [Psychrobacter pasteurii]SJM38502.1 hypothetical protein A1019T_02499 [Psychrobacter pasteurii]